VIWKEADRTVAFDANAEPLARRYLREGSLEWLLQQSATEYDGMFLYYPKRASLAPKLRAFIDVAKKTLKSFE